MNESQLKKFLTYLQKNNWSIFGPVFTTEKVEELSPFLSAHLPSAINPAPFCGVLNPAKKLSYAIHPHRKVMGHSGRCWIKKTGRILIKNILNPDDLNLDDQLPFYSFKRFFVPEKETLFNYSSNKLVSQKNASKVALVGMNILDLKAVNLYDQVFEKDPYYQARRRNLLIVGYSLTPETANNIFKDQYEEDILEHLPFDIFLAVDNKSKNVSYKVFTGSIKGQRILEHFGYKDYEHVQFSGPVKEGRPDERMERLRDRLKNHHHPKIWEELGKICIECGKCTLVCPTCFCFRIDDRVELGHGHARHGYETPKDGTRQRCWDSCYYQEFSEVATPSKNSGPDGYKFLNSTAERLHFWYFHKFARIPDEFNFIGCVGCNRCTTVCPVGINISKVLEKIENS